jgi:hypothetical protein
MKIDRAGTKGTKLTVLRHSICVSNTFRYLIFRLPDFHDRVFHASVHRTPGENLP